MKSVKIKSQDISVQQLIIGNLSEFMVLSILVHIPSSIVITLVILIPLIILTEENFSLILLCCTAHRAQRDS